jgi:hypothetical protein
VGHDLAVTDFRLAAFMVTHGVKLLRTAVDPTNPKEVVFFLQPGDEAVAVMHSYVGSTEERYDAACRTMQTLVKQALKQR